MAARKKTSDIEEEFRKLLQAGVGSLVQKTILGMDELASKEMNSRKRREELASDLNEWSKHLMGTVAQHMLNNEVGLGGSKVIMSWLPAMQALKYSSSQQLSKRYLDKKQEAKSLTPPSFFRFSGDLAEEVRLVRLPQFEAAGIRVRRDDKSETWHQVPGVPGKYKARAITRNERGEFAKKISVVTGWEIDLILPHVLQGTVERPENLLQWSNNDAVLLKLSNGTGGEGKTRRVYRPLLQPYLAWYRTVALPDLIRSKYQTDKNYQASRGK